MGVLLSSAQTIDTKTSVPVFYSSRKTSSHLGGVKHGFHKIRLIAARGIIKWKKWPFVAQAYWSIGTVKYSNMQSLNKVKPVSSR